MTNQTSIKINLPPDYPISMLHQLLDDISKEIARRDVSFVERAAAGNIDRTTPEQDYGIVACTLINNHPDEIRIEYSTLSAAELEQIVRHAINVGYVTQINPCHEE